MPNAIPILLRMHMPSFSDLAIVSYLLWRKKYGTYVQKYPIPLAKAAELANEKKGKMCYMYYRYYMYCRCKIPDVIIKNLWYVHAGFF